MFTMHCSEETPHEPHDYTKRWRKVNLPFLRDPESYPDSWNADYHCPGWPVDPFGRTPAQVEYEAKLGQAATALMEAQHPVRTHLAWIWQQVREAWLETRAGWSNKR